MTEPLRLGIVGVAGIGGTHADAIERADGAELIAGADLVEESVREFAEERNCAWYTDHVEMIEDADLDAVTIGTPSGTHAGLAIDALEAGAHVLCEKPLDVYRERVDAMIKAAEETDRVLAGVFQHRTDAENRRAYEAVRSGELGDVILADTTVKWYRTQGYYDSADWRGTREMDGGCLMNQAIHSIDLLQWIAGDVTRLCARTDTIAREMEMEDAAVIALEFENGAFGSIEATTAVQGGQSRLEVNGTEGSFNTDSFATPDDAPEITYEPNNAEWGEAHATVVQDFVDALRRGRDPMVPAHEARKPVDIILAAYESVDRDGEWIDLEAFRAGAYG